MSVEVEETVELDEQEMLGPKTHIVCCLYHDEFVTFCGIHVDPSDRPQLRNGHALTCAPCVENHEQEGFCPRFKACRR